MELQGTMKALPRDAGKHRDDWPIFGSSLALETAHALPSQAFSSGMTGERATLAERTYARLRRGLILGQIAPGECVTLGTLAHQFGTSATPVRDALSRLTAANALRQNRQSGAVAPILSGSELDELLQLRLAIEGFAFAGAAPHYRTADWRRFKALHADLLKVAELDDSAPFAAAVWSLRVAILGLARSSVLTMLVDRVWCRFGPTFTRMTANIEQRRRISCLLGTIVTAIGNRDLEQARKALADEIAAGTAPPAASLPLNHLAPPLVPISMTARHTAASHYQSGADHE